MWGTATYLGIFISYCFYYGYIWCLSINILYWELLGVFILICVWVRESLLCSSWIETCWYSSTSGCGNYIPSLLVVTPGILHFLILRVVILYPDRLWKKKLYHCIFPFHLFFKFQISYWLFNYLSPHFILHSITSPILNFAIYSLLSIHALHSVSHHLYIMYNTTE